MHEGAEEADDGAIVREDADDVGTTLQLAVEAFERNGAGKQWRMLPREGHVGAHVVAASVNQLAQLVEARRDGLRNLLPLPGRGLLRLLSEDRH